ncbi:hypothetical protein EV714DRAFT_271785 [Schizophyllum commune]
MKLKTLLHDIRVGCFGGVGKGLGASDVANPATEDAEATTGGNEPTSEDTAPMTDAAEPQSDDAYPIFDLPSSPPGDDDEFDDAPPTDRRHTREWTPPPESSSDELVMDIDSMMSGFDVDRPRTPTPDFGDGDDDAEVRTYVADASLSPPSPGSVTLPPLATILPLNILGGVASSSFDNTAPVATENTVSSIPIAIYPSDPEPEPQDQSSSPAIEYENPRPKKTPTPSHLSYCLYAETSAHDVNQTALRRGAMYLRQSLKRKASWTDTDRSAFNEGSVLKKARPVEMNLSEELATIEGKAAGIYSEWAPSVGGRSPPSSPERKGDMAPQEDRSPGRRRSSLSFPVDAMPRVDEEGEDEVEHETDSETDSGDEAIDLAISSRSGFYIV